MERKLVKHGESTLMVSLPRKWVGQQGLHKGDKVNLTPSSEKLVVARLGKTGPTEIKVHFPKADYEDIRGKLGPLYRKGYTSIKATFDNPRAIFFIQIVIRSIFDLEIVEQAQKSCTIKRLEKSLPLDPEQLSNKVFNLINTEFTLVRDYLYKGIKGKDEEIKMIRDDCWNYRNTVYISLKDTTLIQSYRKYFYIHLLEYNGTFLYWLYRAFDQNELKHVGPEFLMLFDKVEKFFKKSIEKIREDAPDRVTYITNTRDRLLKDCEEYIMKNQNDSFLVTYIALFVQNIQAMKGLTRE